MKIGLIGLPRSGKTTLFNAVAKAQAQLSTYAGAKAEPNHAVAQVADPRVAILSEAYKPKKTVHATIDFMDFPGVEEGSGKSDAFSGARLADARKSDALALVVRNFPNETGKPPMPAADLARIEEELGFADLVATEGRLERIAADLKRNRKTPGLEAEGKTLERIREHLQAQKPIRDLQLSVDEEKPLRGFGFLTQKPSIAFMSSSEDLFGKSGAALDAMNKLRPSLEFAGKFEMELSRLEDPAEVKMKRYLRVLAENIREAYSGERQVQICVESEDITLDIATAMPCGLMVTELLTNSLKHAFPPTMAAAPHITIQLTTKDEFFDLVVRDNGVGFPEELDAQDVASMGLKLVRLWATHQMGGTFTIQKGEGAIIHVTFPRKSS